MIKKVHVVFKTHLDIGFTDTAQAVTSHYLHSFIPAAIRAAEQLNRPGEAPRFIWTVGAYLIDLALRELPGEEAGRLERAVLRGDICYHALPFTTHSELCSGRLFRAGLGISKRLDERFHRRTIAAKMSDVPGHSRGIIAPLVESGVKYLHIGINAVAAMPKVPPLFIWENEAGQQIMVNYARSYGGMTLVPGHDEALYFLHSGDNSGPPSPESIRECFEKLQSEYPEAEIRASTLDAFAASLLPLQGSLPLVRGEIGDTWIHGVGSDPLKTARLRALDRLCESWEGEGLLEGRKAPDGRPLRDAFLEQLLLVCEHTWGLDSKKYLTDFANWTRADFEAARKRDLLRDEDGLGRGYDSQFYFARREFEAMKPRGLTWQDRSYQLFESSHQEQRAYIDRALALLPGELKDQARRALSFRAPQKAPEAAPPAEEARLGDFLLRLRGEGISLSWRGGEVLRIGLPLYQEVGLEHFDRLSSHYLVDMRENADWAIPDNLKPGAERSDAPRQDACHWPRLERAVLREGVWQLEGSFLPAPVEKAGCPAGFRLSFEEEAGRLRVALLLHGKAASRKPEALYLPFEPVGHSGLRLRKLDELIRPEDCLWGGNRRVHAVQSLLIESGGLCAELRPLDSPLVCLSAPSLLDFEGEENRGPVFANLYNNLWNTNFKMWYEEDILSRFELRIEKKSRDEAALRE